MPVVMMLFSIAVSHIFFSNHRFTHFFLAIRCPLGQHKSFPFIVQYLIICCFFNINYVYYNLFVFYKYTCETLTYEPVKVMDATKQRLLMNFKNTKVLRALRNRILAGERFCIFCKEQEHDQQKYGELIYHSASGIYQYY